MAALSSLAVRVDSFRPSGRGRPINGRAVGGAAVPEKTFLQGSWIMVTVPNSSRRAAKKLALIGTPLGRCWFSSRRSAIKLCKIEARHNAMASFVGHLAISHVPDELLDPFAFGSWLNYKTDQCKLRAQSA